MPDEEYEAKHSKNGELQILYLAVSGSLHAMFVLHYVGDGTPPAVWNSCKKRISSCWCPARTPP